VSTEAPPAVHVVHIIRIAQPLLANRTSYARTNCASVRSATGIIAPNC